MSEDLIKRSDAIKAYNEAMEELVKWQMEEWQLGDFSECEFNTTDCKHIVRKIEAIPSADRPQEWIPSMSACCRTCEYRLDGVKSDHTLLGSGIDIDSDMDGFICLALAYEGVAHWMLGVDEDKGICEMYKERSRR